MRRLRTAKNGFTMVEIAVVMMIMVILLGIMYGIMSSMYRYYGVLAQHMEMRAAGDKIASRMQNDINAGGAAALDADLQGIRIKGKSGETRYRFKNRRMMATSGNRTALVSSRDLSDVTFIRNGRVITVNMTFRFDNLNKHKPDELKMVRDLVPADEKKR